MLGFISTLFLGGLRMKKGLSVKSGNTISTVYHTPQNRQWSAIEWCSSKITMSINTFFIITRVSYRMYEWMIEWVREKRASGHFLS